MRCRGGRLRRNLDECGGSENKAATVKKFNITQKNFIWNRGLAIDIIYTRINVNVGIICAFAWFRHFTD
jgi:hypothetical protein